MITRLMTLFDKLRGGAWPPSARTVRRPVKSGNERDPRPYLPARTFGYGGDNRGTASAKLEEGVDDGRSVCPESAGRAVTRPHEAGMRSNRVSQSRGEYVPAPCTHRPSRHPKRAWMRL